MIHFIWSSKYPLIPGTGGSEVYTIGQARELKRRGIDCDIITVGFGKKDGRKYFPDVKFHNVHPAEVSRLEGTCVFVSQALALETISQSYVILHCPPFSELEREEWELTTAGKKLIVTSFAASDLWAKYFSMMRSNIDVVYPFADPAFSTVHQTYNKRPTILFAGRLTPMKGIYTLLAAIHDPRLAEYDFKVVKASAHTEDGKMLCKLLRVHPRIKLVEPRTNPQQMAELLANCDVLVMPTSAQLFTETFGMLSIEAQHAGCRVVASDNGGLPETSIGGLTLVEPDNVPALADGIVEAIRQGRLSTKEREQVGQFFTLSDSVDNLLKALELD